jgi:hypothetical protein
MYGGTSILLIKINPFLKVLKGKGRDEALD